MRKPIIGIMMRCEVDSENKPYQYVFDKVRSVIIKSGGEPLLLCPVKVIDYYHSKWTDFGLICVMDYFCQVVLNLQSMISI